MVPSPPFFMVVWTTLLDQVIRRNWGCPGIRRTNTIYGASSDGGSIPPTSTILSLQIAFGAAGAKPTTPVIASTYDQKFLKIGVEF